MILIELPTACRLPLWAVAVFPLIHHSFY